MKKLFIYKFTILTLLVILYGLLMPSDSVPDLSFSIPHLDKVVHCGLFTALTLVLSLEYTLHYRKTIPFLYLLFFGSLFGLVTELLQGSLTAGRMADPLDLLADITGVCLGSLLFPLFYNVFNKLLTQIKRVKS